MRPLTLPERGVALAHCERCRICWWRTDRCRRRIGPEPRGITSISSCSGFPAFQRLTGRSLRAQLDGYLDRIVDVDLEESGLRVRRPATVRAWLRAFAAATATSASWEKIRAAATPGRTLSRLGAP